MFTQKQVKKKKMIYIYIYIYIFIYKLKWIILEGQFGLKGGNAGRKFAFKFCFCANFDYNFFSRAVPVPWFEAFNLFLISL